MTNEYFGHGLIQPFVSQRSDLKQKEAFSNPFNSSSIQPNDLRKD